jgi:phage regulator Rha-like protein
MTEAGEIISFRQVEEKVLELRGQGVILDSDVAELYGVETKRINEAVANNLDKFPEGYIIEVSKEDHQSLKSKFSTLEPRGRGQHTKYPPKAFTEKGLYMLATILKSAKAAQTTIAIVETFAKIRELSRAVSQLSETQEKPRQKALMQKSGEILADILDDGTLEVTSDETTIEINFAIMKIRHTVKRGKKGRA